MKKLTVFFAGILALSHIMAEPFYGDPDQPYDQIPGTMITPHTPFLNPLSGSKLRVLYIQPYNFSREVVEFKQRFDHDYTVISVCDIHSWYSGYSEGTPPTPLMGRHAEETVNRLAKERLALTNQYDLIVLGCVSWPMLSNTFQNMILEHVKRGTGLLYVDPNMTKPITGALQSFDSPSRRYRYSKLPETQTFKDLFRINKYPEVTAQIPNVINIGHAALVHVPTEADLRKYKKVPSQSKQVPFTLTATQYGKGRIVTVDYYSFLLKKVSRGSNNLLSRYMRENIMVYDQHFGLLAKCALWAAGKELKNPEIIFNIAKNNGITPYPFAKDTHRFFAPVPGYLTFDRAELKKGKLRFSAKNVPAKAKFHYVIKDRDFKSFAEGKVSASNPVVSFPVLPEGYYTVTAMLEDEKGGKLDFVSRTFCVIADTRITEVKTEKNNFVPGDEVKGSFRILRPLRNGEKVEVDVVDTWNRVVRKVPAVLAADRAGGTFRFTTEHAVAQLWDVFVTIQDEAGKIASKSCYITLPHNDFKDFDCYQAFSPLMPADHWWRGNQGWITFRRAGVKGTLAPNGTGESTFELIARNNAFPVYYDMHFCEVSIITHFLNEKIDINKPNRGGSLGNWLMLTKKLADTKKPLNSKDFRKPRHIFESSSWLNSRIPIMKAYARFASPMNVIGAEGSLVGEHNGNESSGFGEEETAMFQEWCKKEYNNDLAALNKEWNTSFKNWNEVCGIMLNDAMKNRQYARWVDFRIFMRNKIFTGLLKEWTRMLRGFDPKTPTAYGAEYQNFDMSAMDGTGFGSIPFGIDVKEYGFAPLELMLSFSGDKGAYAIDGNASMWVPKISDPLETARNIWKHFIFGCTMQKVGMEQWSGSMGGMNYLTADYSEPLPFFKRFMGEVGTLQKGVSRLILNSKPMRSNVAILFNSRNHYISRLLPLQDNGFSGGPWENLQAVGGAPEDAMILMNTLRMRPTFIGPQHLENPEVMNKYKALILPYNVGMSLKEAELIRSFVKNGGFVIGANNPGTYSEHGKKLEKPRLADLFPVTNKMNLVKYGKGHVLYASDEINGYHGRANAGNFSGADSIAAALKKYANSRPVYSITDKNGLPVRNVIANAFDAGTAKYLGVVLAKRKGTPLNKQAITIDLKKKYYVWEARTKKFIGYLDKITFELDLMPRVFAILPANPEKIEFIGNASCKQGETYTGTLRIKGNKRITYSQVCHVEVSYKGKKLEHYSRNVTLQNGFAKVSLPISFSEKPGSYQISITDAVTGISCIKNFQVKGVK